jgi:Protein of unknown function (DUF3990)
MSLPGIPPWTDQDIELYHGTVDVHVASILRRVRVRPSNRLMDFGLGFYTTTSLSQAQHWANGLEADGLGTAAVIRFRVPRDDLTKLDCRFFVRGDPWAIDYWSFVQYCRTIPGDHNRQKVAWYDIVVGPVTGTWKRESVIQDSDQISFHTKAALDVLNASTKGQVVRRRPE